jgi:hypothetical protein
MVLLGLFSPISSAKENNPPNPDGNPPKVPPYVIDAYRIDPKTNVHSKDVRLGQTLTVKVSDFNAFDEQLRADCKEGTPCQEKQIGLFVNRKEIRGLPSTTNPKANEIQFRLLRRDAIPEYGEEVDKQQKALWAELFGFRDTWAQGILVNVSVGPSGGKPIESNVLPVTLVRLESNYWLLWYCVLLAVILVLYAVGINNGLFSDRGSTENGPAALSLARLQMGLWFFLVVAAFLFIWLVIGELPTIPPSVLTLIGIAGGTTLGAGMIDTSKRAQASAKVQSEQAKQKSATDLKTAIEAKIKERDQIKASLETQTVEQQPNVALSELKKQNFSDLSKQIEGLEAELRTVETQLPALKESSTTARVQSLAVHKGELFADLFMDGGGWSFHRVQMGIWTLVLSFVFVGKVLENLAMPEFDASLLALMGISSGTYLGFKFPEQQPAKTS